MSITTKDSHYPFPQRKIGNRRAQPKMSGLATKQQSHKIFEKLKTKPANKVSERLPAPLPLGEEAKFSREIPARMF